MKYFITILFIFISVASFCQQSFSVYWKTNNEIGVVNFQILQSTDSANWNVLATVLPDRKPDSNKYSYVLTIQDSYYKIMANMIKGSMYYTPSLVYGVIQNATVSNVTIQNKVLQWDAANEANVKYYSIEQSVGGNKWTETQQVKKGSSSYKIVVQ